MEDFVMVNIFHRNAFEAKINSYGFKTVVVKGVVYVIALANKELVFLCKKAAYDTKYNGSWGISTNEDTIGNVKIDKDGLKKAYSSIENIIGDK